MDFIHALKVLLKRVSMKNDKTKIVPFSAALDVETGPYSNAFNGALAAVDAVHQDGKLPQIPLKRLALSRGMHGRFLYAAGGQPLEIAVHYASSHAELTTVHEIGHFLDYVGVGTSGDFSSIADPALDGWR